MMLTRPLTLIMVGVILASLASAPATTTVLGHAASPAASHVVAPPLVVSNPNTERAGVLRDGVLTVALEARAVLWQLNGPKRPAMTIEAFSEPGKAPLIPGPLLRVPAGTTVRLSIHNSLAKPIMFSVPAAVRGGQRGAGRDSVVVAPGGTELFTTHATVPGNYIYRAVMPTGQSQVNAIQGLLGGAFVVDTAGRAAPPHDRVLVLMETPDSTLDAALDTALQPRALAGVGRGVFTINGRSWPHTERLHATVGDTLHWRVLNASGDRHPMHLHGSYFRVDDFSGAGPFAPLSGQFVATQLMVRFQTMSMTWVADRPGNWLFHCHYAVHLQPDSISAAPDDPDMRDMTGLVIGTIVAPRPGVRTAGAPSAVARRLRLVAVEDGANAGERSRVPSMHFLLEDRGRRIEAGPDISPELDLVRGEPVAITIVNRLREPTSVHWHGVEVQDSYVDGVPGFSGEGQHLSPAIAPGDSFVARFTPPRAGTFMYHAHVDELREQTAGLMGALIVREPDDGPPVDEHTLFIKSSRLTDNAATPLEINGRTSPDTVVLRAGHVARFRVMNLSTLHHNTIVPVLVLVAPPEGASVALAGEPAEQWQVLAKDGFPLPAAAQAPRRAQQMIAMGETYDFAYTPTRPGTLRLELVDQLQASPAGPPPHLLVAVPIRVR